MIMTLLDVLQGSDSFDMRISIFSAADQLVLVLKVGIAAVLGGIIGWERDRAGKSAGTRHTLGCEGGRNEHRLSPTIRQRQRA